MRTSEATTGPYPIVPAEVARPIPSTGRRLRHRLIWATMIIFALFCIVPIYWILITALRPRGEIFESPALLYPQHITLDNLRYVWLGSQTNDPVLPFVFTSFLVATASACLTLFLSLPAAYALSRWRVGGNHLAMWILSQRFIPPIAVIVPLYLLYRRIGWLDTYHGLILLYTVINIPITVWILRNYIDALPRDIEEAALVDGATPVQILRHIVLPLSWPSLGAAAILAFLAIWNEYVFAYQLAGRNVAMVTVYFPRLRSAIGELYGEVAAAGLLALLPALLVTGFLRRYIVRGLTLGGGREL